MILGIYVLTIIYAWFGKERKHFWLWCTLVLVLLVNTSVDYADFNNYENYFHRAAIGEIGIDYAGIPMGWYYLCLLFDRIGMSYRGMVAVVILISMYLIHISIKGFAGKKNVFWGVFIIFPGLIQCVQVRFFLGTSIVFVGLMMLINKEKRASIKFIVAIVIASLFHASCCIFIIFLFLLFFDIFNTKKAIIISVLGSCVIFLISNYFLGFVQLIIPSEKFDRYFTESISKTSSSWLFQVLFVFGIVLFFSYIFKQVNKKILLPKLEENNYYNNIVTDRILKAIALLCITIPFLKFDRNFHRFLELAYMLSYVSFIRIWKYMRINPENRILIIIMITSVVGVVTYIYTPFDTVIAPFFTFSGFHSLFK